MTWCVYDILVDGELVYVGCTRDPKKRIWYHKARGKVPRSAVLKVRRRFASHGRALIAERDRIMKLTPPLNVIYNPNHCLAPTPLPAPRVLSVAEQRALERAIKADQRKCAKAAAAWAALDAEIEDWRKQQTR
jgi:hypothetical protein